MSKMNHFFHYEDSPFASQQNISDRSPHVEVLWEFGPKHSKRSSVKRRAPFSKWMSCFGIEITMDYLIVEDYNHTSLKEKINDWNFFRHWNQTMLFLGKPLFEKRSVFGGIALIAFDPLHPSLKGAQCCTFSDLIFSLLMNAITICIKEK